MGKKAGGNKAAAKGKQANAKKIEQDEDALLESALKEVGAQRSAFANLSRAGEDAMWRGDLTAAVASFTEAITADPSNGEHYARRSEAHLHAGRYADAIADAKTGAELGSMTSSGTASCYCQLGFALARDGKLQAALEAYERGLKHDTNHPGCRQGVDEVTVAVERSKSSGPLAVVAEEDDAAAQQLLTLPTPEEILGKGFEVVILNVGDCEEPLRFLLSTTLVDEAVVLPATCGQIGIRINRQVDLDNVRFQGGAQIGSFKDVAVTQFVQASLAQQALGVTLHGMLGLPFLARYDMDLDRVRTSQRFKAAGAVKSAKEEFGARSNCGAALHMSGIRLPCNMIGLPVQVRPLKKKAQNFLGVLDTSSMFSVMNWQAAKELGIANGPNDSVFKDAVKVVGATAMGPAEMPVVNVKVNLCGAPEGTKCAFNVDGLTKEEFEQTGKGKGWSVKLQGVDLSPNVEFGRVNMAIGDALQFAFLRDSAVGDFNGGAVLVGQDVLAQARRLTLSAKDKLLWIDPPRRLIDAKPI